jgi:hypothetical protein
LGGLLRQHGLTPEPLGNIDIAWTAFCEFLAMPVDGLESELDSDADGFIGQWGRQFAVDVRYTWTETDWYQRECCPGAHTVR